jgi:roadblock/LC7 domain-containing protein
MLRGLIQQGKKATDPEDLSGVLAAGSFRSEGRRVQGRWPIQREFLEAVAADSE